MARLSLPVTWSRSLLAGILLCTMSACMKESVRPTPVPPALPAPTIEPGPEPEPPRPEPQPTLADPSPWARLRSSFVLPGCEVHPRIEERARRLLRAKATFIGTWQAAMPFLLVVIDEIERRDLAGELALLPFIESRYRPVPAGSRRAAGMWQLVAGTARAHGVRIDATVDERLDAFASTHAALDLLEHLHGEFADWRLAIMAYNAGEFRLKRALAGRNATTLSMNEIDHLAVSATTHQFLDQVFALNCIIRDPERFDINLPEADADSRLVTLDQALDLRLVERLTGLPLNDLQRFNAAHDSRHVHIPAEAAQRLSERLSGLAQPVPVHWRTLRIDQAIDIAALARQAGADEATLVTVNQLDTSSPIPAGTSPTSPRFE